MPKPVLPEGASPARRPTSVRLQIVTPSPAPPEGEGWLHEIKHDGHRLVAIIDDSGRLRLISRNGYDRTEAFGAPFGRLAAAGTSSSSIAKRPGRAYSRSPSRGKFPRGVPQIVSKHE